MQDLKTLPVFCLLLFVLFFQSCQQQAEEDIMYVCGPCNLLCDTLTFHAEGSCPHCGMDLISKTDLQARIESQLANASLEPGSGSFLIEGKDGHTEKYITVYYHRPANFSPDSKILMVVPGAGRNGDRYRDAWIEESEALSLLILSPMFSRDKYPFEAYHMGGLLRSSNLQGTVSFSEGSNIAQLDEEAFKFKANQNPEAWIFKDLDRIFDTAVDLTGSSQKGYDVFGHSAGGQILHRMALFHPHSKANRIVAANSGFYTLPDLEGNLPFGMKETRLSMEDLKASFESRLILLIGEEDNADETGGTLLRSPTVDKQGLHRLERGQFFYSYAKEKAEELGLGFNWEMEIVPGVGHDHKKMGDFAAKILYP